MSLLWCNCCAQMYAYVVHSLLFACGGGIVHVLNLCSGPLPEVKMTEPEVCVLHLEGTSVEPLSIDFQRLLKFTNSDVPCTMYNNSKFFKIILRDQLNETYRHHSKCYNNVTVLHCICDTNAWAKAPVLSPAPTPLLRSSVHHPSTSTTDVFKPKCIFCNKIRQNVTKDESEEIPTTLETEMSANNLKEAARLLNEHKLLVKISGQDFIAKELKLHHSWRNGNMSKAKRLKDRAQPSVPSDHEKAIGSIKPYVQQTLVDSVQTMYWCSWFKWCIICPSHVLC